MLVNQIFMGGPTSHEKLALHIFMEGQTPMIFRGVIQKSGGVRPCMWEGHVTWCGHAFEMDFFIKKNNGRSLGAGRKGEERPKFQTTKTHPLPKLSLGDPWTPNGLSAHDGQPMMANPIGDT